MQLSCFCLLFFIVYFKSSCCSIIRLNILSKKYDFITILIHQYLMQEHIYNGPDAVPNGFKDLQIPDLSDLPSGLFYFYILNQTSHHLEDNSYPYVHTYRDTNTTFGSIMTKYITDTFGKVDELMEYYFAFDNGDKLTNDMTVNDLLKVLGRTKTDGIFLLARNFVKSQDNGQYYNESAFVQSIQNNWSPKDNGLELRFATRYEGSKIEEIEEISYVPCKFSDIADIVQQHYLEIFSKEFALPGLNKDSIVEMYFCNAIGQKTVLDLSMTFKNQQVYESTTINVVLKNPNKLVLKRAILKKHDCQIIIYKENQAMPIRVNYDDISHLTFQDFYKSILEKADSKNKRDAIYCLKVMDIIIRPNQRMNIIQNLLIGKEIKLVAHVVNEKMIFYGTIPKLTEAPGTEFKIDEINIPEHQKFMRDQCRDQSIKRSAKAKNNHFKKSENIEPIMVYTAELKYLSGNKQQTIYVSLNTYLRQNKFIEMSQEAIQAYQKEWRLRYASSLLKQLEEANKIQKKQEEMVTWRGISYDPLISKNDIGKIITFKQFTSTSIKNDIAVDFAIRQSKKKKMKAPFHLMNLIVKTGTPIIEYSIIKKQAEVLLNPYTEFQVKKVQLQTFKGTSFNVYYLQEVLTSKEFPKGKENYIVWIDDKLKEGKAIYEKIKLPTATTVMRQIASTTQLQAWLKDHPKLIKDSNVNLVFITNMTRKENKQLNGLAGIEGARKIREFLPEVPIFFYIGDMEAAKKKVNESQLDQTNIKIGNKVSEIQTYLKKVLDLKEL